MPQDKRRSISYRSFVTCDDPKGVECGAIRKSKINSQKKEKDSSKLEADSRKQGNNQNTSVAVAVTIKEEREKKEMGVRGITRGLETTPVTFQLLEVSKDAEKLNHVINSWSNEKKFKGNPNNNNNNIAKDLLKGALDLQESLVMLEKLREASSYMLGLPRKQKQKLEDGKFDGMVNGARGFQRSPFAVDGRFSRKSCDEMRNVVRESLLRQNVMITNPIFEEHHHFDQRKMGSPDMMPSTSSSQSSMIYSSNFVPSDSSVSSSTLSQRKKGKDSNLIVKLMGLESFPSSPRKLAEKEKFLNLAKPMYDNDSPRAKRPQFGAQEGGVKQRSVEEILENLKVKGLLRNSSVNGLTIRSQESDVFSPKNDRTPIVVMKPLRYPCLDLDKPIMSKIRKEMDMKPRINGASAQETVRNEAVNFSEKYEVSGGIDSEEKTKSIKKDASVKVKAPVNLHPKPLKKQIEVKKATEIDKVITSTRRKGEEKNEAKLSDLEKFTSPAKIKRKKDGKSISKNQTSSLQKTNSPSMLDQRKQRTTERKKNRQLVVVQEEKKVCKGENRERKAFCKADIDSRDDSKSVFPTVSSNDNEICEIQIQDNDINSQTKMLATPESILYDLSSDKKTSHNDDSQSAYSEITSVSTSEYCSVDQLGETQSPLGEVTLSTTHENGVAVHHDTNLEETKSLKCDMKSPTKTDDETSVQCLTPRTKLKALFLSNSLFVSQVKELFNIQVNPDLIPCVIDNAQDLESSRLLLDCANEVLELKSQQLTIACMPLPQIYSTKTRKCLSLDQLLEEVCNEIEDLRWYLRPVNDDLPSDDLYVLLDRDLRFISGVWGVGWRSMYTQVEVEQVIGEVDRFILSKLIEEVLVDFML